MTVRLKTFGRRTGAALAAGLALALALAGSAQAEYARTLVTSVDRELRSVVVKATGRSEAGQETMEKKREAALADAKRQALAAARAFLDREARENRLTGPYRLVRGEGLAAEEAVFVLEKREQSLVGRDGRLAVYIKAEVVYETRRGGLPPAAGARLAPAGGAASSGKPASQSALPMAKTGQPMPPPAGQPAKANDLKKTLEDMTEALGKRLDGGGKQ